MKLDANELPPTLGVCKEKYGLDEKGVAMLFEVLGVGAPVLNSMIVLGENGMVPFDDGEFDDIVMPL